MIVPVIKKWVDPPVTFQQPIPANQQKMRDAQLKASVAAWNEAARQQMLAEKALLAQVKAGQKAAGLAAAKVKPTLKASDQARLARERDKQYRKLYGISLAGYDLMLEQQGGVCAICHKPPGDRRLVVDHCHASNQVRGLLCNRCNLVLGFNEDDAARLERATSYLILGGYSSST